MRWHYNVIEVSDTNWQEIMDSDVDDINLQHLNKWGDGGWELVCIVPRIKDGDTVGYGIVFKKRVD